MTSPTAHFHEAMRRFDERRGKVPRDPVKLGQYVAKKLSKLHEQGVLPVSRCPHCGKELP